MGAVKPRVHEIASELGVDSKVALAKLKELGEFVKSPSSTIEPAVARKLRSALIADGFMSGTLAVGSASAAPAAPVRPAAPDIVVPKPRVHEIASELGVDSKVALAKLKELGEFVKSPSSTIEPPVARKLRSALLAESVGSRGAAVGPASAAPAAPAAPARPAAPAAPVIPARPAAPAAAARPVAPVAPAGRPAQGAMPAAPNPRASNSPKHLGGADAGSTFVAPEDFVGSGHRLFIDTNVFMNTDQALAAGLRQLFERSKDKAVRSGNGIVVPTKVIDELTKHARADADNATEERVSAIRRAGQWVTALKSAAEVGLVRMDLGDKTNPYADDLFVDVFTRFGFTYDMCLVTNDITLRLRVRLLGADAPRQLIAGTICPDGRIEVESAQALFERATRKLARIKRHIDEGLGKQKDHNEVESLEPLLAQFQELFQVAPIAARPTDHRGGASTNSTPERTTGAFKRTTTIKPPDESLPGAAIPGPGDGVNAQSSSGSRPLILGEMIGDGGEGRVYGVLGDDDKVVKIFDADHRTSHRKAKIELLLSRDLKLPGIGFPTAAVTNGEGDFVGYEMPRASGDVLQATIMRPARFKRTYPNWTKADLVDVCISFLEKVAHLHSLNILLGDINPKNLMVDANKTVWIIDADSWQIEGYPCPVGTPMFTASSITGEYAEALRTPEEERFAVATMLFMILITGQFPYARSGADGGDFPTLIREGKFAFQSGGPSDRDQPEGNWKYMWSHLPPKVKRLFWNTFHRDGSRHDRRPTANEWLSVFRDYRQFFGGADDFDPMSNDVYPFRFRAFRPDTPIKDCPQCHRPHAIVGIWDDDSQTHRVLPLCYDCNQNKTACSQCGKSKPASALVYGGRCWECYQKRDHARCANCGTETRERFLVKGLCTSCIPVECNDCRTPTPKSNLSYGRCSACQAKQNTLDPSRQCARCGRPFITYGNVAWHQRSSRPVPTSHKYGDSACVAPVTTTRPATSSTSAASSRSAASSATRPTQPKAAPVTRPTSPKTQPPAKKGFWSRLADWLSGNN